MAIRTFPLEDRDKPLQEKCGLVAIYSSQAVSQLPLGLTIAGGVQHRGQHGAGMCAWTPKGMVVHRGDGLLKDVFPAAVVTKLDRPTFWTMIHCRYGTSGGYDAHNVQPCLVKTTKQETIAVIHNGQFVDISASGTPAKRMQKKQASDTVVFTQLLAKMSGKNWDERLLKVFDQVKGAYSLVIGIGQALYAIRDPFGIRPLFLGYWKDQTLIASETHALDKVGASHIRSLRNGEVLKLTSKGPVTLRRGSNNHGHFCDLERAYFSRPNSMWVHKRSVHGKLTQQWTSFAQFRYRCGLEVARQHPISNVTFVVGVPDSGISIATGYAAESKSLYYQAIVRDHHDVHGDRRLFLADENKKTISHKVLGKLSLIQDEELWNNAVVVVGDDSLIRGNVSAQITRAIFALGASQVHWIFGFPPVQYRCHLGVSMRTEAELLAAKHKRDTGKIAKEIGATSVYYISNEGFVRTYMSGRDFKKPKNPLDIFLANGGCGGCITGRYPV